MGGIGGCANVGGICIGCTMPGFPDKFQPFMDQPPGSLLSSEALMTYGKAVRALRRFTQDSLNSEPAFAATSPAPGRGTDARVPNALSDESTAIDVHRAAASPALVATEAEECPPGAGERRSGRMPPSGRASAAPADR